MDSFFFFFPRGTTPHPRQMNKTILVARGGLPDTFPPLYAVAMAVSKLVGLPAAAIGPLSVLLATEPVSRGSRLRRKPHVGARRCPWTARVCGVADKKPVFLGTLGGSVVCVVASGT